MTGDVRETLRELARVYRDGGLLTETSSTDYDRDRVSQGKGGHGSHKARTAPSFGGELPFVVELEHSLARFVAAWAYRLEVAQRGPSAARTPVEMLEEVSPFAGVASQAGVGAGGHGDQKSTAKRTDDEAILAARGADPVTLAFLYGRSEDAVRRLRGRRGFDPVTGERIVKDNLTAPRPRRDETTEGIA